MGPGMYAFIYLSYVWLLSCCNNCIKCSISTVHTCMLEVTGLYICVLYVTYIPRVQSSYTCNIIVAAPMQHCNYMYYVYMYVQCTCTGIHVNFGIESAMLIHV